MDFVLLLDEKCNNCGPPYSFGIFHETLWKWDASPEWLSRGLVVDRTTDIWFCNASISPRNGTLSFKTILWYSGISFCYNVLYQSEIIVKIFKFQRGSMKLWITSYIYKNHFYKFWFRIQLGKLMYGRRDAIRKQLRKSQDGNFILSRLRGNIKLSYLSRYCAITW